MATRLPFAGAQYWDATNKEPYAGAKMYTYSAGTTSNKDTYTDAAAGTTRANPVVADANGIFPEVYGTGDYNIVIKNSDDTVTIYSADNIATAGVTPAFSTVVTSTQSGWPTPSDATMLKVTCVGAGGGGGGADEAVTNCAGGGGSGAKSVVILTTLDSTYDLTVGTGGAGAADNTAAQGTAGGDTDFSRTSGNGGTTLCLAKGGQGGQIYLGGQGGDASSGTGNVTLHGYSGHSGYGANPDYTDSPYPGGNGGGRGGGRTGSSGDEDAETNSGGGGAGGSQQETSPVTYQSAGAGADGYILIEYWT